MCDLQCFSTESSMASKDTSFQLKSAIQRGDVWAVKGLLQRSATIEDALLVNAAAGSNSEIVQLLIEHGASVNACVSDAPGNLILTSTPLHACARYRNLEIAKLLLSSGALVNAVNGS